MLKVLALLVTAAHGGSLDAGQSVMRDGTSQLIGTARPIVCLYLFDDDSLLLGPHNYVSMLLEAKVDNFDAPAFDLAYAIFQVSADSDTATGLAQLARELAVIPQLKRRLRRLAIEMAGTANTLAESSDPDHLDTLAIAYAANNQFDRAQEYLSANRLGNRKTTRCDWFESVQSP